jgi:large subunit ribosomal protein L9
MPVEVILRRHVDNLGRCGEIVKVADGYARNYLLPLKIALPVTEASRRQIARERGTAEAREAEEKRAAEVLAQRLGDVECVIARMVGEADALYGSVTNADISDSLAAKDLAVEKRRILLPEPLKHLGEFVVPIRLHPDVTAQVKVRVVKEDT